MDVTLVTVSEFRQYYTEFSDGTAWTNEKLTRFLLEADEETNSKRWGNYGKDNRSFKRRGMYAYAAHKLLLDKVISSAVANGGTPSAAMPVQSKSVGDESISFAVPTPDIEQSIGLGDLRSTAYGIEFLRLRKRAGMGFAVV
jgi:hypothetical protein